LDVFRVRTEGLRAPLAEKAKAILPAASNADRVAKSNGAGPIGPTPSLLLGWCLQTYLHITVLAAAEVFPWAQARDAVPELGADLQAVCWGAPELSSAAVAVGEHCLDERASVLVPVLAGERELLRDELELALAEALDVRVAHCLDVTVWAAQYARVLSELVPAESVQVSPCLGPVGSASEFFPVSAHRGCSSRLGATLLPHRVAHGSPKLASSGWCSPLVDAAFVRLSSERAADGPWPFLPVLAAPQFLLALH